MNRDIARERVKESLERIGKVLLEIDDKRKKLSPRQRKTISAGFANIFACAEILNVEIAITLR